jgi:predicted HicB family RNase H-like nuclease
MKPIYDPYIKRWVVKGLGYYDTLASAKEAIKQNSLSDTLLIRLNPNIKQQLKELAESKNVSVSDVVRELIEKEVNENER